MADWRASLFDRLNPGSELEEDQKAALSRQGLLALASGLLGTGGGFGNALSSGIQGGLLAMNQGQDAIADRRYKQQVLDSRMGDPAGLREFEAMAKAAGYDPGSEGYQKAARTRLGTVGRVSSAGFQKVEVVDENGVPRLGTMNGSTGRIDFPDGTSFDPQSGVTQRTAPPQSGGASFGSLTPQPAMTGDDPFASLRTGVPGLRVTSQFRTPEENAKLPNSVPNSFHLTGQAIDIGTPSPEQRQQIEQWSAQNGYEVIDNYADGHVHIEPRSRQAAAMGANPFVGRTKEAEAAAVTAAQQAAELAAMPTRNQLEAQGAGMTTAAQEAAKIQSQFANYDEMTRRVADRASAEARAKASAEADATAAKKSVDSMDTLGLLEVAEGLVQQSTGSGIGAGVDAVAGFFGQSNEGANAIASLKTIAGQLISKMPRMEGPQSDKDVQLYKDMAGNLANPMTPKPQRLAALETIRMLNERYAKPAEPSLDSLSDEDLLRQLGGM